MIWIIRVFQVYFSPSFCFGQSLFSTASSEFDKKNYFKSYLNTRDFMFGSLLTRLILKKLLYKVEYKQGNKHYYHKSIYGNNIKNFFKYINQIRFKSQIYQKSAKFIKINLTYLGSRFIQNLAFKTEIKGTFDGLSIKNCSAMDWKGFYLITNHNFYRIKFKLLGLKM
ncbi:hypothetical protein BpHYR1_046827 [Brachionus plicatilis]|uniref:Uncharacterized protein n=1 Tax=Brachionus plicatilis TaxID=10195 RepID=A0A3M7S0U5_BRAPC|nr:hypothetical protein BpHYR1_046827 [Brachionus plicatilis]